MSGTFALPFALWLPSLSAPLVLSLALAPARWFGPDPTTGFSFAVIALTLAGVGNAALSLAAPQWWSVVLMAVGAHVVLVGLLLAVGLVGPLADAGPAAMAVLMPILFPALAFIGAGIARGLWALLRGMVG